MRKLPQTERISFITQKLLLIAIYQGWIQTTLTEAATAVGVSKMTVTRCFDELQALGLPFIKTEGKMRRFLWEDSRQALWKTVRPILRNPVSRQYRYGEKFKIGTTKLGGISAISHYSMLADSPYTVCAVSKADAKALDLNIMPPIPDAETPEMVVQVMPYDLDYGGNAVVDPLTAILSMTDEEMSDPRVEAAVEEILEDCLHVKGPDVSAVKAFPHPKKESAK